jgi:thiol:disulfide interchange protein DsbD
MNQTGILRPASVIALLLATSPASAAEASDAFSRALAKGPIAAMLAAFAGGLLVSLTPCVYPMVAVTVSVFGARQSQSRREGILLSTAFVLGIMVTFVALGLGAAATGSVFGSALQNRLVVLGISALFVVMALSMFGVFEFALPAGILNRLAAMGGMGLRGAFVLGLVSGIVASPCTGPVLTGILAWIATTRDFGLGTLAMSAFALGLGVPFFAVGAFAVQLPKSGRWMVTVKFALGIVLLIVALYFAGTKLPFLLRTVPYGTAGWLLSSVALVLGIAMTALVRRSATTTVQKLFGALTILAYTSAGFAAVTKLTRAESTLTWEHQSLDVVQQRARDAGKPLIVDFTASWCTACKELDRLTFAEPRVRAEAGRFVAVKVDASVDDDPRVVAETRALAVKGLPTVVLFDSMGRERRRFTDFVNADQFLSALREID